MNSRSVHRLCRALLVAATATAGVDAASAASTDGTVAIGSHSGQFVVNGKSAGVALAPARVAEMAAAARVDFDANLAAVSCERIRGAFNRALRAQDRWQGRVHVALVTSARADLKAQITTTRYRDGWQYRLEVLNPSDEESFVRAVTQVLLQELANRSTADRAAEIPLWLTVGLTRELMAREPDLVVRSQSPVHRVVRAPDAVLEPRRLFASRPALTFDELSWPTEETFTGERRRLFDASAQLLVHQLLRLPDGPAALRKFLAELPPHLNWQIAFLRAYEKQFPRLLDVEKWWAVTLAAFTGRNQWQMLPAEAALDRFHQALLVDVEVRTEAGSVPGKAKVTPQTVLEEWDYARQQQALRGVVVRLAQMRLSLPPELLRLLDDYRAVFENYLSRRPTAGYAPFTGSPALPGLGFGPRLPMPTVPAMGREAASSKLLARDAIRRLNALDVERENFRAAIESARQSAAGARGVVDAQNPPTPAPVSGGNP